MKSKTKQLYLMFLALALSITSVIIFYKSRLGVNIFVFSMASCLGLIITAVIWKRTSKCLLLNSLLIAFLGLAFALTTSVPVRVTVSLALIYMILIATYNLSKRSSTFEFWRYFTAPIEICIMGFISSVFPFTKLRLGNFKEVGIVLRVLLGIVLAIPILALFLLLLSSADLAFKDIISRIFSYEFITDSIIITIWSALGTWFVLGTLYYLVVMKKLDSKVKQIKIKLSSRFFVESVTILSLVEILFLIFNIVQIAYLFGGERMISGDGYNYSEYARKGFFELIAVAVIALILIASIFKIKSTKTRVQEVAIRIIGIVGLVELLPMTISAFYRLYMYENAYGFTRLRVYSHLFILYLIVVFIWFFVKFSTRLKERLFLYGLLLISVGSLVVASYINVDGAIARINIDRYKDDTNQEKELDLEYLHTLSYDATLELINFYKESKGEEKDEVGFYLEAKYNELLFDRQRKDFRSFTVREELAFSTLDEIIDEIRASSEDYKGNVVEEYKNSLLLQVDGWQYASPTPCKEHAITHLYANGKKWYPYISEVYAFENPEEPSETCEWPGKYFLVTTNEFERSREIFVIETNDTDKEIFLISRTKSRY